MRAGGLRRWNWRLTRLLVLPPMLIVLYLWLVLSGLLPANGDFRPPAEGGVEIFVVHNDVHTDLVLPAVSPDCDWRPWFPDRDFRAAAPRAEYLQLGWGERTFYLETPTWADLRPGSALRALFWPTGSVMHVEYRNRPNESPACRRIVISRRQYGQLVRLLQTSFQLDDAGRPRRIPGAAYHAYDAFYEGRGSYHLLHTCNCWTGDMLRGAGVRIGLWTPLPQSVMWSLPTQ